jgi:hypothetical protein
MVDSVADWPLHQVISYLKKKEKEEGAGPDMDCRLFNTSGIRMFNSIIEALAEEYEVSRGKICRWASYHGLEIAKQDMVIINLQSMYSKIRKLAIEDNSNAVARIQENPIPYCPVEEDGRRVNFYVYSSWVLSDFVKLAGVCGVVPAQMAQIYILRSILTCDLPLLSGVSGRLETEVQWWKKWMEYRSGILEMAVSMWSKT